MCFCIYKVLATNGCIIVFIFFFFFCFREFWLAYILNSFQPRKIWDLITGFSLGPTFWLNLWHGYFKKTKNNGGKNKMLIWNGMLISSQQNLLAKIWMNIAIFFCNPFWIKQKNFQHPIAGVPLVDSPFDCRFFSRERNVNANSVNFSERLVSILIGNQNLSLPYESNTEEEKDI